MKKPIKTIEEALIVIKELQTICKRQRAQIENLTKEIKSSKEVQEAFEEAYDLIECIRPQAGHMPHPLRGEIEIYLRKHSEKIYGFKDYLDE